MAEPLRVLIVENAEDDALLLEEHLRDEGFAVESKRVETASQMRQALERVRWDLVLSDYVMPHFDGLAALGVLKESGQDIPFIIVSGSIGEDLAVSAMKAGAHDYLMKGKLARLGAAVQREVREARAREEKRRAEAALRESEQRFRLMADKAPVLIWIAGPNKGCTWFNRPWLEFTGRTMEQELGDGWAEGVHPDDRERCLRIYSHCFDERRDFRMEYRLRRHDGEWRWLLDHGVPLLAETGEFSGYIGSCTDVTEERAKAEELTEKAELLYKSNKDLERFAYVAAHDLQEPLRMIGSYSQLLLKRLGPRVEEVPDAREFVGYIREGVERMEQLIRGLLEYSRVVHDVDQRLAPTPTEAVVERVLHTMQGLIDSAGATVTVGELPTVMADGTQLLQVFQNLLSNAIKYRREGVQPQIHISAQERNGEWVFSVADNGIGIAPEYHDRIFGIFKRLHREEYPGLGLGLATTQRLVEMLGGRIWVESAVDQGATFYFTLPQRMHPEVGQAAR